MPGFDTSNVAAEVGQGTQQPNALQTVSNLAALQGQLNTNKMFPGALQGQQIANARSQQELNNQYAANYRTVLSSVAPGADAADYAAAVARGIGTLYSADYAASQAGNTDFAALAKQAAVQSGSGTAMEAQFGTPETRNLGGKVFTVDVNRVTGQANTLGGNAGTQTPTLSPSEINTPAYTKIDPTTGVPEMVTKGAAAANPSNPAVIQTGLPPGAAGGREAVGVASGNQYAADLAGQTENGINIAQMKEVDQLLQAPEGQTGPGTQAFNKWRDAAIAFLGPNAKLIPGLDANTLQAATQDELRKYMTRLAGVNGSPFGAGTDYRLAQAATGNANPDMSNLANRDVERMNLALSRAQQARLAAFQQTGLPPEQYSTWASNWSRQVDPRAFMLDLLSPAERQKMLAPITNKGEIAAMTRGVKAAESAGLFGRADIPGMGQ